MTWQALIPIIAQYGFDVAEWLWRHAPNDPSEIEWSELKSLAARSARDRMLVALAAAGVDPESDRGKVLLAAAM